MESVTIGPIVIEDGEAERVSSVETLTDTVSDDSTIDDDSPVKVSDGSAGKFIRV